MRKPDKEIHRNEEDQYLDRWHLIPRNPWFNIYLHRFTGSDYDGALHDHPWWSVSFKLSGKLREVLAFHADGVACSPTDYQRRIRGWIPYIRSPITAHRMILDSKEAWTLFITGPRLRDWGFYPDNKWVDYKTFTSKSSDLWYLRQLGSRSIRVHRTQSPSA